MAMALYILFLYFSQKGRNCANGNVKPLNFSQIFVTTDYEIDLSSMGCVKKFVVISISAQGKLFRSLNQNTKFTKIIMPFCCKGFVMRKVKHGSFVLSQNIRSNNDVNDAFFDKTEQLSRLTAKENRRNQQICIKDYSQLFSFELL
ncbi:MAG: hypothetical protein LDLANPLL_00439 [Turneriella sp.]|nr:hypothetical protein [Turneriella sp.]